MLLKLTNFEGQRSRDPCLKQPANDVFASGVFGWSEVNLVMVWMDPGVFPSCVTPACVTKKMSDLEVSADILNSKF